MADLADVEAALCSVVNGVLYPTGTSNPSALGVDCRVYRGWPNAASLDADLRAGKVNVSVYAQPNVERNTTRFPREWKTLSVQAPLITLSVASNVVTVGGSMQTLDVATIKLGHSKAYSVAVQSNSTTTTIATALAALISADFTASSSGPHITISTGAAVSVAVGGTGTSWMELRRQTKGFQVIVWTSTPAQRDTASAIVDKAFAKLEFLSLTDGSAARILYVMTRENDAPQKELLYRRDLFYSVEYPTTDTEIDTQITAIVENVKGSGWPIDAPSVVTIE